MKKFFLFSILLIGLYTPSNLIYIHQSWNPRIVKHCLNSTVVIFKKFKTKEYLGTGIIIKSDGTILTAAHVVTGKDAFLVIFTYNRSFYEVKVIAIDPYKDLALIQPKASAQQFEFCKIQPSDKIFIGKDVLVIGHPFGEFYTVTSGIISQLSYHWWRQCHVIETDTLINPGNSGGPMLNQKGEIIGIVSMMKIDMMGWPLGIGIATSIIDIHKFINKYEHSLNKSKQIKLHSMREFHD
jgi:S1-C subfamily serine protease